MEVASGFQRRGGAAFWCRSSSGCATSGDARQRRGASRKTSRHAEPWPGRACSPVPASSPAASSTRSSPEPAPVG